MHQGRLPTGQVPHNALRERKGGESMVRGQGKGPEDGEGPGLRAGKRARRRGCREKPSGEKWGWEVGGATPRPTTPRPSPPSLRDAWASPGLTHHFKLWHRAAQGPLLAVHKGVCGREGHLSGLRWHTHLRYPPPVGSYAAPSQAKARGQCHPDGTPALTPSSLRNSRNVKQSDNSPQRGG